MSVPLTFSLVCVFMALTIITVIYFQCFPIENLLDHMFEHKAVRGPDGSIYMHRWYTVRNNRVAIFIHKFVRSDYDRALHDHPWDFIVIPIWRGYVEHHEKFPGSVDGSLQFISKHRVWPIIGTRFRRAEYKHCVELLPHPAVGFKCSWSIFIRFRKRRHWGFWCSTGWEPQQDGRQPCEI